MGRARLPREHLDEHRSPVCDGHEQSFRRRIVTLKLAVDGGTVVGLAVTIGRR